MTGCLRKVACDPGGVTDARRVEYNRLRRRFAGLLAGRRLMRHVSVFRRAVAWFDREAELIGGPTFHEVMAETVGRVVERMSDEEIRRLAPACGIDPDHPAVAPAVVSAIASP